MASPVTALSTETKPFSVYEVLPIWNKNPSLSRCFVQANSLSEAVNKVLISLQQMEVEEWVVFDILEIKRIAYGVQ